MPRISLKTLTVSVLLVLVLLSVLHTLVAKLLFREAALDAQFTSLSRVIEVAAQEVLKQLRATSINVGHNLQHLAPPSGKPADRSTEEWTLLLDEPFIKGFVGAGQIELAKLRIYDLDLNPVAQSHEGLDGLPQEMPAFLRRQAAGRQGAERLKALGGLWQGPQMPLYSVLVPLGGLRISGYLEVVTVPRNNLPTVGEMIQRPIDIHDAQRREPPRRTDFGRGASDMAHITYTLVGDDGRPAYQLVASEDMAAFYGDMHRTQLTVTAAFLTLTLAVLLVAFWLFNRQLFRPMHQMITGMEECLHGDIRPLSGSSGVKELSFVAEAFNVMAQQVRKSIQELQRISLLDGLTGIANRRHFDAVFIQEWQRGLRAQHPLSVLMIDIDHFKQYNDTYGHQAGDECLRTVAKLIGQIAKRPSDLAARYGGEEFVLLLPHTGPNGACHVAEKLQLEIAARCIEHKASATAIHLTLSIGIATLIPTAATTPVELLEQADSALYQAKRRGRNRIEANTDTGAPADKDSGI